MKTNVVKQLRALLLALLILGMGTTIVLAASRDIVVWDFEGEVLTPSIDEPAGLGGTPATAQGGPNNGTESFPAGNGSTDAWSFNGWSQSGRDDDIYFQFRIDLTYFGGMTLYFDDRASSTGPQSYDIRYSTDGGTNWTDAATAQGTHPDFTASPMNTHSLGIAAGSSDVIVRIYGYGATASTGTWRIDNVRFFATTNENAVTMNNLAANSTNSFFGLGTAFVFVAGLLILRKRK